MKFIYTLSALAFVGLSLSYPIEIRSNTVSSLVGSSPTIGASGATDAIPAATVDTDTKNDPNTVFDDVKTDATAKATTSSSTSGDTKASSKTPTAAQVKTAAANFATDANTVSANINTMADAQSASQLKTMATTAFKAETDEDAQRAVLAAAAGSAGAKSNSLIVKNTPAVLTGLKAIMQTPTSATTKTNLKTIQAARNPNILPSITQLSNSAMQAVGLPQTAQKFPATTG